VSVTEDGISCTVGGERVHVYGGLLAENWTQATARDVLAYSWLRCADAGFVPVLSVHDELVFELAETSAQQDLERVTRVMETPMPWAPHLPLKVDGKLTPFYAK
jgi:DNA polymerase